MKKFFLFTIGGLMIFVGAFMAFAALATTGTDYCGWFELAMFITLSAGWFMITKAEFSEKKE